MIPNVGIAIARRSTPAAGNSWDGTLLRLANEVITPAVSVMVLVRVPATARSR